MAKFETILANFGSIDGNLVSLKNALLWDDLKTEESREITRHPLSDVRKLRYATRSTSLSRSTFHR